LKDKVKQLSESNYRYVSKIPPHFNGYHIWTHYLTSLHPFQDMFDLRFLNPMCELSIEVI
jgi:hypothetical protein